LRDQQTPIRPRENEDAARLSKRKEKGHTTRRKIIDKNQKKAMHDSKGKRCLMSRAAVLGFFPRVVNTAKRSNGSWNYSAPTLTGAWTITWRPPRILTKSRQIEEEESMRHPLEKKEKAWPKCCQRSTLWRHGADSIADICHQTR